VLTDEKKAALARYKGAAAEYAAVIERINTMMRAGHAPSDDEFVREEQLRLELLKARHDLSRLGMIWRRYTTGRDTTQSQ